MTSRQVIHFEFQQSLSWDSDRPRWSESLQASVHLTDAALSSGWLRQHFSDRRGGANDFLVLVAIVMHARPLRGADLEYLERLGMATHQDEGRLYARVTDLGLSEELGMHRTTIAASAERLKQSCFIDIGEVPEEVEYRDSKGRFAGSKVYLLSGELQKHFLSKEIQPLQGDRVGLSDMDRLSTVSVKPTHRDSRTDINLRGGGGGDSFSAEAEEKIWQLFAALKGDATYQPTPREKRLLRTLYADGYTTQETLDGIQSAFREVTSGESVRHFGFCVTVIRTKHPQASPVLAPDSVSAKPGPVPAVDPVSTSIESQSETPQIPEPVLRIFTQANQGRPLTATDKHRLNWLHEECVPVAELNGQDAWEWIVEALKSAAGQAHNLLPYTTALVRKKMAQTLQRNSEGKNIPDSDPEPRKKARQQASDSGSQADTASNALARRVVTTSRSGFVIPADYSQAALLRALELIPDDQ